MIKYWDVTKKSTAASKQPSTSGIPYINMSLALFESILKIFVHQKRMRVEIYATGDDRKWALWKKGSPGNHQQLEDLIYTKNEMQESTVMVSLKVAFQNGQTIVGAAYSDVILKTIGVCEFLDNEQFTNLESLLLQIGAKECISLPKDPKDKLSVKMHDVLERCSLTFSEKSRKDFETKSIEQDLRTLFGEQTSQYHFCLELKHAMGALACLISELDLLSATENASTFKLIKYDLSQYMRLDSAATTALNIVPTQRDENQRHSLYGLLNRCKTSIGSRKLMQWIKQPLLDKTKIERRLDCVEIFVSDIHMLSELRAKGLRGIADLERLTKKLQRGKGSLQDCVAIYHFANKVPLILSILGGYCGDKLVDILNEEYIQPLKAISEKFQGFIDLIEEVVDFSGLEEGEYQINPNFDDILKDLENQKKDVREKMKRDEYEVKQKLKSPDHFTREFDKVHGWVYRVTKKEEKILSSKENKKIYTVVSSSKGGIKFQNTEIKNLSMVYQSLVDQYQENCVEIISKVLQVVLTYSPVFEEAHELISSMDVIAAFADASNSSIIPYTRPTLYPCGEGSTVLKQSRHPILESQPDMNFIANDVSLVRDECHFIIITGPNMGGKSTYIRQIGVVVLMAQIGCFIPCDEGSTVSICDSILARVGAGDSQLRGISTFMAEMLETSAILSVATKNSLIIIDELGRGTSTYDGFGLAWAISEHICKEIGAFCLFATHFHELTQLEQEVPFVKNKHVSAIADGNHGLILQYQVCDGPSDQSFGIHVAKIAKFPEEVIKMAEEKASELEHFEAEAMDLEADGSLPSGDEVIIDEILKKFSDIPIDSLSPEEAANLFQKIREDLESKSSPLIKELICRDI